MSVLEAHRTANSGVELSAAIAVVVGDAVFGAVGGGDQSEAWETSGTTCGSCIGIGLAVEYGTLNTSVGRSVQIIATIA